jgi:uncharacterized protein (TIGR03083 family)
MSERLPADIRDIAAAQVERLAELVAGLSEADLAAPTLCAGWLAAHLLVHVRQGLDEQALSFAEPASPPEAPDRDYASYWRDWPPAAEPATFGQVRYYWAAASAYATAAELRKHFADTARSAAGASRQAPAGTFRVQGHVMAAEDILAMWTAEWVIHQLDLTAGLPGRRLPPTSEALALTVRAIDTLTGTPARPMSWSDATYIGKATGRLPLDHAEQRLLGRTAAAFPVLG